MSYGVRSGWQSNDRQTSLFIGDATAVEHVPAQLDLLEERLQESTEYSIADFAQYKAKCIGQHKMFPMNLLKFAESVETVVATDELHRITTPQTHRERLAEMDPKTVSERVQAFAGKLMVPSYVVRTAFGENPFKD